MDVEDLRRISWIRALCANGAARGIRLGAGLSLREVADAVGVGVGTVHRWESGGSRPTGPRAIAYARALEQFSPRRGGDRVSA